MVLVGGCEQRPTGPLLPGAIAFTPLAMIAGTGGLPTAVASATPSIVATRVVEPPEPLSVPTDFHVSVFADEVGPVRALARAPNGDIFASLPRFDQIVVLPDRDGDGVADQKTLYYEGAGLHRPAGLAFHDGDLFVANTDGVVRFDYETGDLQPSGTPEVVLPLPGGGDHWSRLLRSGADGLLYVSAGASCDVCREDDPRRATVIRFGGGLVQGFALGLRDVGGLAFQPLTGALWATDNERSGGFAPSELNQLRAGANFGWPNCYGDRQPEGSLGVGVDSCRETDAPAVPLQPRSEPWGLVFAETDRLPGTWRDDLFVAFHGNSDSGLPVGYKIGRVVFEGGLPTGEVLDFITGWLRPDTRRWGRPSDLLFASDGALLIADDGGERIYRVHYDAPTPTPTPFF
jgi:glucose/arabinose dehydrogenase